MPILIGKPQDEKELIKRLLRYSKDHNWIKDNYERLFEKYPMKYIAVKNKRVRYIAESMEKLVSKIIKDSNIPGNYAIDYLTNEKCNYLF